MHLQLAAAARFGRAPDRLTARQRWVLTAAGVANALIFLDAGRG